MAVAEKQGKSHAPPPPRLRTRAARTLLPTPLLRAWQIHRVERRVKTFKPRMVSHRYHGIPLTLRIADPLGASWYDQDWPESVLPEFEFFRDRLAGSTVFETGAHQGIVALMLGALVGPEGRVVAVEANPHTAGIALHNVLLNRMPQVTLLAAAGGEAPGEVLFKRLGAEVSSSHAGAERVPCVTVDLLAETYGQPDLLWIDVEGFECQVLRGATRTLAAKPNCCVEVHVGDLLDDQGGSVEEVLAHFGDGYELYVDRAPNDRLHGLERFTTAPAERFSLVAARPGSLPR